MKIFGVFYGGLDYGLPDLTNGEYVEEFFSIQHAMHSLADRQHDPYYPCVEAVPPDLGGMYMLLFKSDPHKYNDSLPDYQIEFSDWGKVRKLKL